MSLAERRVPETLADNHYVRFGGRVSFGWLSNDFFPDGYIGDPTAATAELGAELFEGSVQSFCEALREISDVRLRALIMGRTTTICASTAIGCGSGWRRWARSAQCTGRTASVAVPGWR